MKKIFFITIILILLSTNFVFSKDEIIRNYKFDSSEFNLIFENNKLIDINNDIFEKGEFGLPYKNIKIFYESNLEFVDYEIKENKKEISINIKIEPEILTNASYYRTEKLMKNFQFIGNFKKGNENFILFKYYPVIFSENFSQGIFFENFEIIVRFKPEYFTYKYENLSLNETYLIIGKKEIETSIKFFTDYKKNKGFNVVYKPLNDFYDSLNLGINYKIRSFLTENYQKLKIKYLLLIGDEKDIPPFKVFTYPTDDFVYSDFFFGELTSNLDYDKDKREGEPEDDKIDFYSEIMVGRIPSSNINNVITILQRSIDFEKFNDKNRVLSAGAIWNFEENILMPLTDGAESLKIIFDETFMKSGFSNILLAEKEGLKFSNFGDDKLDYDNFIKYTNEYKPSVILWQGHGYIDSTFRKIWLNDLNMNNYFDEGEDKQILFVDKNSLSSIKNQYPSIVFMGSCDNMKGYSNSLASDFINNYGVGAIAATDTSWYGIGWNSLNSGWFQSIMYKFSEYLSKDETISSSLVKSKEYYFENFMYSSQKYERYANIYVFNVFGDPEISLKMEKKYISTNSVTAKTNEIFKIDFNLNIKVNNARGSIEYDPEYIKLLKMDGNEINYSIVVDGKIIFKVDNIKSDKLFSMIFFGKKEGEINIKLININFNNGEIILENFESDKIFILKRNYPVWDINQDGICYVEDFIEFSKTFGSYFGNENYNSFCDFNMDGKIDGLDLLDFSIHFSENYKGG